MNKMKNSSNNNKRNNNSIIIKTIGATTMKHKGEKILCLNNKWGTGKEKRK